MEQKGINFENEKKIKEVQAQLENLKHKLNQNETINEQDIDSK